MISARISNNNFRARIEEVLSSAAAEKRTHLNVGSFDAEEVTIHPGDHMAQVIAFTSDWLQIDSDDPLVSHVSKQGLLHELDYAAFCGISNVVIAGPKKRENISQYAQVINTALSKGAYMQLLVLLPMAEEKSDDSVQAQGYDEFSTWDIWNTIRTVCKYNTRLSVGE